MSFRKRTAEQPQQEVVKPQDPKAPNASSKTGANTSDNGKRSTFVKLGAIIEKKDGGVYLKVENTNGVLPQLSVDGKKVKGFQIEDPTVKFERMVNSGKMTEAEAEEKAAKIPDFVLYEVTLVAE